MQVRLLDGELDECAKHLASMEEIDPHSSTLYYNRLQLCLHLGEFDQARDAHTEYEKLLGRDSEVCTLMADIYIAEGKKKEAVKALEEAHELNPEDGSAMISLSRVVEAERWEEVSKFVDKLLNPKQAYIGIMNCAWEDDEKEKLKCFVERFRTGFPDDASIVAPFDE